MTFEQPETIALPVPPVAPGGGSLTSVVIPCFNAAATLGEAIESVFEQGVRGERLIVVDDGSRDDSARIAEGYGEGLTLVRLENGGASRARNTGLGRVVTKYVLFLDADDVYEGPIVAGLERAAEQANADIAFGATQNVHPDGKRFLQKRTPPDIADPDAFAAAWLEGHSVQTNSHFWRADFLRAIGGWDEDMAILEEIEHVARGVLKGARLAVSLEGASLYRHNDNPNRLAFGKSEHIVRSAVRGFEGLGPLAAGKPMVQRAIGKRLYIQARTAFRLGYADLGRYALGKARELGFTGHSGTRSHCLAASVVGLELKERLLRRIAS